MSSTLPTWRQARADGAQVRGAQAVDRALEILKLFNEDAAEISVGDAARALETHRSTASRLLATLERHGLVEQDPQTQRFRLGLALISYGGMVLDRFPVRAAGRVPLAELRDSTGENSYLGVLDGAHVLYIDQLASPRAAVASDWLGRRQNAVESACGRLLLAYEPAELGQRLMAKATSEGDAPLALDDPVQVRARSYTVRFPVDPGASTAVAAAIRDRTGAVIAGVSVSGPRYRIDRARVDAEIVPAVAHAAARISEALGGLSP